jgi:Ssp1 endopeptidase immunity protein Rap1a
MIAMNVLRRNWWIVPLSAVLALVGVSQSRAVTPDNFRVTSTGDLVALCSAEPTAPEYTAAIHFCHGFASGAYQYYQMVAAAIPPARFVCTPEPPPSRSDAIAGFVEWARRNPSATSEKPVDSMFRYLAQRYPCAPATASR